ncbi:MAG TPA: sugar phosphate isomerase/epimerase family protein [Bryobacteraceae bacterium]|jgi:sugar phosphate isomerase/epimerase|nr:sugar phosphate isomerase/epimerase family protein [Bryobacteraceae bacterium]
MKLGLINSAWFGSPIDTAQGIQLTKEIGFDSIDIFADPLESSPQELRTIRESCSSSGLPVISVVCCALGIADFNGAVRRFHIDRAKRYLDMIYDLRGRNLLLVAGEYIWNQEVITPAEQWNWAVDGVRELGRYAKELGLEVALELEPFHLSIINTVEKMDRFLAEVDEPSVKANVDVSHLVLARDPAEKIAKLAGRIAHVHLSDCDGVKHGDLPPGRGVVDFPPYLKAIAGTGFNGTISIELEYSPEPSKIVDWVREAYQSSSSLMNTLGIRN